MSASDGLTVTVHGAGGHGSAPHQAQDPVTVIAEMVTALQVMVTRQFDMFDPVVLSVGVLQAGTKRNIIPDAARLEATVRSYTPESRARLESVVPRLLNGIAAAHGVTVTVEYTTEYPPTVTDAGETGRAGRVVGELFGGERFARLANPLSGSEDFSRVLQEVPGTFVFLSALPRDADAATAAFNHSPAATFDDNVLPDGTALYAQLALSRMAELAG
jgi:hippurate hydrolase